MIVCEFPPNSGGQGYYVYNLSKKLVEKGHKVTVITRGSWTKTLCEETNGVNIYRAKFPPCYPFHLQTHGVFVNQLLKLLEPCLDVLHLHNPNIPVIHTSLPTIVTEHGTAKSHIENFDVLDFHSLMLKMFSQLYISIDQKIINNAGRVTAVSHACARELEESYSVKKAGVLHNGVDTAFFTPAEKTEGSYVLYTGALISRKGLLDLVKSAEYVRQSIPNVKFILTGKGPLEKLLKKTIHMIGLDENFSFLGYIGRDELLRLYQNAMVYVLPSYYEGLPTTLLEAMACGTPTVATNVPGNSEVVSDGITGFLVPPRNPEELADAILKILSNDTLRRRMGDKCREEVIRKYDWSIIARRAEEIYSSL
jgi:glycosyltransferase involved in cell wall biosynthesis